MPALFLFCGLPVVLLVALLLPPGQSPDEMAHLARADSLTHFVLIGGRGSMLPPGSPQMIPTSGARIDAELLAIAGGPAPPAPPAMTAPEYRALFAVPFSAQRVFLSFPNTIAYFPAAYLPASLALGAARLLHLRPMLAFLLARLCMAASFLLLGFLALRVAAYGQALLFTLLLLPMTLFLAGTLNQDGVMLALTCLACACLTRGSGATRGSAAMRLIALGLFLPVALSKPPYLLLLGGFALPLLGRGLAARLLPAGFAAVLVAVWVGVIAARVVVPFFKSPYQPGPLYHGGVAWFHASEPAINLHILLQAPIRLLALPWRTLRSQGGMLLNQAIGLLGLLQIPLAPWMYPAWKAAFGAVLFGLVATPPPSGLGARAQLANLLVMLLAMAATLWLVTDSLYVSFDPVGLADVIGLQGRYLLPVLPFLLLAAPKLGRRLEFPALAAAPALALAVIDLGYLPWRLVTVYYLR